MSENKVKLTNGDRWTAQQFLDHYFNPTASGLQFQLLGDPHRLPWICRGT